jgi:CelD/BcsL family acetyltransferase involved in cellulose biosynthesis
MPKIGYDAEFAKASPGQVIRKRVFQHLMTSRDAATYDLMAGGGEHRGYKLRWMNCIREYDQIRLFNPRTVRGWAASALLRLRLRLRASIRSRQTSAPTDEGPDGK